MTRSLQSRLTVTLSACALGLGLVAGAISYRAAFREAWRFQDDQLQQLAALVDQGNLAAADARMHALTLIDHDYRLSVKPLDGTLSGQLSDGFHTLQSDGHAARAYVRTLAPGVRVMVSQPTEGRNEIARNSGLRTALPFLVLIGLLIAMLAWTVRRAWRPLQQLAADVDARRDADLRALDVTGAPTELAPFLVSMNRLLARQAATLAEQRRFVADAAHELRSPLTALVLQAENLSHGLAHTPLDGESRGRLAQLQQGLGRTRALLDQLLTLARAQHPGTSAPLGGNAANTTVPATPLLPAVREALEDVFVLADRKGLTLELADATPGLRVAGTHSEIVTLLRNLVGNAVRYTPDGGAVSVRLTGSDGCASIDVIDTGPGIAAEKRPYVFDAFYRAGEPREEGTGLGLAIVRAIVDRLGGSVQLKDADTQAPHGLHVRITLPAQAGEVAIPPGRSYP